MQTKPCQKLATKNWYEKNKDSYFEIWNESHVCCCGGKYTKRNFATHCKTLLHLNFIAKHNY